VERVTTDRPAGPSDAPTVAKLASRVLDEVERAVVGKRPVLELVLLGFLADGHVLLDDVPGVAKTLTARSFATVLGCSFGRIQFTPDLLPGDITGSVVYNQRDSVFEFRPGPVFTNVLLGDEVNRAPAKTQAALLEAMAELQVTVDGRTHPLPRPFLVVATENPIEHEGTYSLPEAQLDRFLLRTSLGYPSAEDEWELLDRRLRRGQEAVELQAVLDPEQLRWCQRVVESVYCAPPVGRYIVSVVAATRDSPAFEVGASPRGTLALARLARARAALGGRDYVLPDDVKHVAVPALAHRLVLATELWIRHVSPEALLAELVESVPAPAGEDLARPSGSP